MAEAKEKEKGKKLEGKDLEDRRAKISAARNAKLTGVFGEGRVWEITESFEQDAGREFRTFLGHAGKAGSVLKQVKGKAPTTQDREGKDLDTTALLVGPGLLKVAHKEFDAIKNMPAPKPRGKKKKEEAEA